MPLTLLAAMLMPTPVPQKSSALLHSAHNSVAGRQSHIRVIHAGGAVGAVVDILQPQLFQMGLDGLFQFKSAVVGGKCDGFCHWYQSFPFVAHVFRYFGLGMLPLAARRSARSRSAWLSSLLTTMFFLVPFFSPERTRKVIMIIIYISQRAWRPSNHVK